MYKLTLTTLLFISFSCASLLSFSQNLQLKKSVAITDFKDITGGGDPNAQPQQDPNQAQGQGGQPGQDPNAQQQAAGHPDYNSILTTMLTTELVKTNSFIVSQGMQPGDAAQFMVSGTITKWATTPKAAPGTMNFNKQFSTITIELQILDASSGAILAAQTATSTVTQKNLFNNKADHTLDSAEHKVILQCVDYIKTASQKLPWQGSVVKVNADGTMFIKPGSSGGVSTGMIFDVFEVGEELKDASGNSLGHDEKKVGSVTVTGDFGGGKAAKASLTSGKGIKAGDILKPAQ